MYINLIDPFLNIKTETWIKNKQNMHQRKAKEGEKDCKKENGIQMQFLFFVSIGYRIHVRYMKEEKLIQSN